MSGEDPEKYINTTDRIDKLYSTNIVNRHISKFLVDGSELGRRTPGTRSTTSPIEEGAVLLYRAVRNHMGESTIVSISQVSFAVLTSSLSNIPIFAPS